MYSLETSHYYTMEEFVQILFVTVSAYTNISTELTSANIEVLVLVLDH